MIKILHVALREYRSTVWSKAFIIGAFIFPIVFYTLMAVIPQIVKSEAPRMSGKVIILDATGAGAAERIIAEFDPAMLARTQEELRRISEDEEARGRMKEEARARGGEAAVLAASLMSGGGALLDQPIPELEFEVIAGNQTEAELEERRAEMTREIDAGEIIAYVEIGPGALDPLETEQLRLQTRADLHQRNIAGLEQGIRQGVLQSRIQYMGYNDISQVQLAAIPPRVQRVTVTETGEAREASELSEAMPLIFMMLLWISTFTGGQYLLMSTIEEKQNRVMEVLLSAVSSLQLMSGKIIGQGAVGSTMLAVYFAFGLAALDKFDLSHLVSWDRIASFVPFFIMAYIYISCMMAAVGAAVTDPREASAMMTPIMMVVLVPFLIMIPIMESPNGALATVSSFIPPFTPFIMAMRLGSSQIVPSWQIGATLALGFAAAVAFVWITSKIFRIGVLMYGKPPNLRTLLRWVRQA